MNILAVDSAANVASAAILSGGQLLCESIVNYKKTHSETLMPMIDGLFKSCQMQPSDIDLFAAAYGPGSFTGLRIGVTTVKGLAHAVQKPVVGVSTLLGLAYNLPCCAYVVAPIMDARRNQVYNGVYCWDGTVANELRAPRAVSIEDCVADLRQMKKKVLFLGDGVPVHRAYIQEQLGALCAFAPANCSLHRAASVAVAAQGLFEQGKAVNYRELVPLYLRKPQAERELEEKKHVSNRE